MGLIQPKPSFFQMSSIYNIYTQTLLEFKSTWTSIKSKEFLDSTNQIMLESLHSLLFKQLQLSVTPFLIFLERERGFPVWFQRLLTKILILEWLETLLKSLSMQNQQVFTAHSSLHFKAKRPKCLQVTQQAAFYSLIRKTTLKRKLISMRLAGDRLLWSCKEKREQTSMLTFLINIYNFSWKMMTNLKKSDKSTVQAKCWPQKLKLFLLMCFSNL